MCKRTVLVVDNRKDLLASMRDYLEAHNYIVLTAQTEPEALRHCEQEVVHLAIIDVRLLNDSNSQDLSGLQLAAKIDESIPKIILTGHRGDDPASLVLTALGPNARGNVLAADFVWKREGPERLLEAINNAFDNRIRLNTSLKITMARGLKWATLVDQLKLFRKKSRREKEKAERVLDYLTRRLLYDASAVHLLRTTPGYGSCTVTLVRPSFNGASGTELAVKFGPRESISREENNYKQWVRPFAANRSTQLREGPVWSREMGAIAYTFVGEDGELSDFRSHYEKSSDDSAVVSTLEDLFKVSCRQWYASTRPPKGDERKPLDVYYREQLNFRDKAQIEKLERTRRGLVDESARDHGSFERLKGGSLRVTIAERDPLTLPDPVWFVFTHNSSEASGDFFPVPSKIAITHGDLHARNVLVGQSGNTWLIDFDRTGWGPALRDFAEMESDIKFNLLESHSLRERLDLEVALLSPAVLTQPVALKRNPTSDQLRAIASINRIRRLASELTDTEGVSEYYIALLFYALKRIVGFTSSADDDSAPSLSRYHALLSAAMTCSTLQQRQSARVFLSYARADEQKVARVYQQLVELGFQPWMDRKGIVGGDEWDRTIGKALRECDFFVACLSENSLTKQGFVKREMKMALDIWKDKPADEIYVIPARLEECEVPERLEDFQWVDLFADDGIEQLVTALREGKKRKEQK